MYEVMKNGWLEVICGSMFSGKSEELIRRVNRATYGNLSVRVFKPAIDLRFSEKEVVSHNGRKQMAIPVQNALDIYHYLEAEEAPIDVVAIDEVQFFDDRIVGIIDQLANQHTRVICAGLDTDFRGEPFGPMPRLMTMAESLTKLTAICPICGSPASRTQRLINDQPASYHDPIIKVGAAESYEPRCRHHHEVPDKPQLHIQERKNQ